MLLLGGLNFQTATVLHWGGSPRGELAILILKAPIRGILISYILVIHTIETLLPTMSVFGTLGESREDEKSTVFPTVSLSLSLSFFELCKP